ncbi:MAG: pullulanase-type alpha-1,6-glucosidase [Woeseiaceae bacterium]|nr:pullulanase-type alpha-1,6-glucosidase [Woeseiaceae bacterium]
MSNTNVRTFKIYVQIVVLAALTVLLSPPAAADHTPTPAGVALVGNLQSQLGCPGDWQPECAATELFFEGSRWTGTFSIPAGSWEYKIALNDTWDESYGANGNNIPLTLLADTTVTFTYDHVTHEITDDSPLVQPASVTIAGDLQSELGCPGDWQPDCAVTFLDYDADDTVWQGVFNVPAGSWQYKAALNGSWDENYGANAVPGGDNIPFDLGAATDVKFFYDHATNWVTSNRNSVIATLPGSFQSALGCPGDWQPDCLRSWLQDIDGDGIYSFATRDIPAGNYETKVAINESWDENYGDGGAPGGANIPFTVPNDGDLVAFSYDAVTHLLEIGGELPKGNITEARAYWLAEDVIAWDVPGDSIVSLHYSAEGGLAVTPGGLEGGDSIALTRDGVVDGAIADKFRHLAGLPVYRIGGADLGLVPEILKGQFAVAATDGVGEPLDATALQPPGVLDDLYTYHGDLGVTFDRGTPTIRVWAPTAKSVKLHVFDDADNASAATAVLPMTADAGTWFIQGDPSWDRKYYLYEVEVFVRATGKVETNFVTDPYSLSLSMDSKRTQIVDLDDRDLKPWRWDRLRKPRLKAPEDIAIYELHVRDFSMHDDSVPEFMRGTFKAFAWPFSWGTFRLWQLSRAGLSHVHLLPAFDCASIPEDRASHATPGDLSMFAPNGEEQQAAIEPIRDLDGFNWCYDPFHYTAPEGSYATEADGPQRIYEFRQMVAGLNRLGLRVVMDVVYNHTSGSGQGEKSVLDRIVPDYYHRLNASGGLETSTCCANTATEHNMMEKLMLDSLRTWATAYKVDGFRFDLMGHHTKANIENARDMLRSLTRRHDGVDGRNIYLYGEGWNFGEVANNARFEQATQVNMGDGTGVGSFNDRMRDGVRGGGPFDSGAAHIQNQGFINGMYYDPNASNSGSMTEKETLLRLTDWIRVGLAGSIADYQFIDRLGNLVQAMNVDYNGQQTGYTSDPQEIINYAAAHDNETLFDISQYKLPLDTSTSDRVRVQNLGNSIIALSQGVPLFHAGQDMLRSKSLDRNSYNSGDWFNVLDFSYRTNGWGRGMPPFADNQNSWGEISPLLGNPDLAVGSYDMWRANRHMREMLKIRKSSKLFRLRTGQDVRERVEFHNTGPTQVPGLVVMSLRGGNDIKIVVLFNASTEDQDFVLQTGEDAEYELHPVQRRSWDRVVRTAHFDEDEQSFYVPARTTAVFVADD